MQCTSNFNQKLKFTEVYVSFQIFFFFFFWHEPQSAGPITKTKMVNVE